MQYSLLDVENLKNSLEKASNRLKSSYLEDRRPSREMAKHFSQTLVDQTYLTNRNRNNYESHGTKRKHQLNLTYYKVTPILNDSLLFAKHLNIARNLILNKGNIPTKNKNCDKINKKSKEISLKRMLKDSKCDIRGLPFKINNKHINKVKKLAKLKSQLSNLIGHCYFARRFLLQKKIDLAKEGYDDNLNSYCNDYHNRNKSSLSQFYTYSINKKQFNPNMLPKFHLTNKWLSFHYQRPVSSFITQRKKQ